VYAVVAIIFRDTRQDSIEKDKYRRESSDERLLCPHAQINTVGVHYIRANNETNESFYDREFHSENGRFFASGARENRTKDI